MPKIIKIHFDIKLPKNSPEFPKTIVLDDIWSVKDLAKNYKKAKKLFPHRKIHILIDETAHKWYNCQRKITLKELKKRIKEENK